MSDRFGLTFAVLTLALTTGLAGCSRLAVDNSSLDYQDARPLPPLRLPADQATRAFVPQYPVPALTEKPANAPEVANPKGNRFVMPPPLPLDSQALQTIRQIDIGKPNPPAIVVDGNGYPILRVEGNSDRIWESLTQALATSNVNVLSSQRTTGRIDIRLDDQTYMLRLGRSGNATTISLQDRNEALADPRLTTTLLNQIVQNWPV
ncbi:MAG: hypothetical protein VXW65_01800 [Pseudomonadota bacterium]|nr:hypothetical protein [Pseudomonadota bacterium]